jgi:hypothetical protein
LSYSAFCDFSAKNITLYGGGEFLWGKNGLNNVQLSHPSRSVEFGVMGVVVLGVHLILRDTQGVSEFTVSNRLKFL